MSLSNPPIQDSQRHSASHNTMPYNLCKRDAKDTSTTFEYDNKLKIYSEVEECFNW